ncbi:MAG: reverse transcriptase domain-containing protein [Patescibacteria group bacterium]
MGRKQFIHTYDDIISKENLLAAWREFLKGKRNRKDVQAFRYRLSDNIQSLHDDLKNKTYRHGGYHAFNISDPKPRNIHKACVRDRLLHHVLYRALYPFFDKTFVADSYSCRKGKGTHRAMNGFRAFAGRVSKNHTKTVWVLKCDIRKFFASIDQKILLEIVDGYIFDKDVVRLVSHVVSSFHSTRIGVGLPLGNLTSQLLVNIYMNEFDQFMKHKLKAEYYIRYADDFVILSQNKEWLENILNHISNFLQERLKLQLHPDKVSITTFASGVDFLGWTHFPDYRVLRTTTKKRIFRGINASHHKRETIQSYLGMISHGNTQKLKGRIENFINKNLV